MRRRSYLLNDSLSKILNELPHGGGLQGEVSRLKYPCDL
jgi:hypothetical protein